jgi:hypothetical protein
MKLSVVVRNIRVNTRCAENVMILNLEAGIGTFCKVILVARRIFWAKREKITRG